MKRSLFRLFSILLLAVLVLCMIPAVGAETNDKTDGKVNAYRAYYDYLSAEIAGIGGPVRDEDYYQMFTDKIKRPATLQKILAVYLVDVTGDDVEELVIKRHVTHKSSALLDLNDAEWICVYSYIDGQIKRIGQNKMWIRPASATTWSYYEPAGYIGEVLSSWRYPNISDDRITVCWAEDGKTYFCDGEMLMLEEPFAFYVYNGTHMEMTEQFSTLFVPDWTAGSIHSQYGRYVFKINGEEVTPGEYSQRLAFYTARGTYELPNNDYTAVLNILSDVIQGKNVPYGDANPHAHVPAGEWIGENGQHYRTCKSGCEVKLDLADCSGGTATCMEKATCAICQQEYGEFSNHSAGDQYSNANGKHFRTCKRPGCTYTFLAYDCSDDDKDHQCDICKAPVGTHEAAQDTHDCEYCNAPASSCEDVNKDHKCDICEASVAAHEAAKDTHNCEYCNKPASDCKDGDKDHQCDICGAGVGAHKAADGAHDCQYCKEPLSNCEDNDRDHECDICRGRMGEHAAADGTHTCQYCNQSVSECDDRNKDRQCDVCGKEYLSSSGNGEKNMQAGCSGAIDGIALSEIILFTVGTLVATRKRKNNIRSRR